MKMDNPFKFHEADELTDSNDGYESETDQRKDIDAESKSFAWFAVAVVVIALVVPLLLQLV